MKRQINEIKKMQLLAGLITESEYRESLMNENVEDLKVEWTPEYQSNEKKDPYFYTEKGLADGFKMINGKKVKEIIGYFEDEQGGEDFEVIGYIYSVSKKDIEIEYTEDDLDDAFTNAL